MSAATENFANALNAARSAEIDKLARQRLKSQSSANVEANSAALYELVAPHVESFNWMFEEGGLDLCVRNLPKITITPPPESGQPTAQMYISNVVIGKPNFTQGGDNRILLPHMAREMRTTYDAPLTIFYEKKVGEGAWESGSRIVGRVPIMVRSVKCHLHGLSRAELVKNKEEAGEWGGYFIVNGNERLVRLLIMPRRNHIFAVERSAFTKRGPEYTKFGTTIRCVRNDQSALTVTVHYLETGSLNVRFVHRKQEFFIPAVLVLKALTGMTDREIYEKITQNDPEAAFISERAELMIREAKTLKLRSRSDVLAYLGRHFRAVTGAEPTESDRAVGERLIDEHIFIHIPDVLGPDATPETINRAKADLLITMIHRTFLLVQDKIKPDDMDAMSSHECLLPGYLYAMILKENLAEWLYLIRSRIMRDLRTSQKRARLTDPAYWKKLVESSVDVGRKLKYFITTGNLVSRSGLDLMQVSGYTIGAEKLNYYRYLSHFRSIHRGQFFTTMKTTSVRKLLPESWGFLCPVHTPDGSPCGLLNHLTAPCRILTRFCRVPHKDIVSLLSSLGMVDPRLPATHGSLPVLLDGVLVGRVPQSDAVAFAAKLRYLKVSNHPSIPDTLEIFAVPDASDKMWPSISLSTTPSRFMRPVYYLPTAAVPKPVVEYIGAMEQLMMEIACTSGDFIPGITTHQEISPTNMLSVIASLTPFSDHNQSPRNMYQCQMGKQTMGTPFHSFPYRVDNKVYRIQNPQIPIVRNEGPQQKYLFDEYPMGTNAIVAVISYTGYDMEDAMIINKFAYERGFGHGSVYKYKEIDLSEKRIAGEGIHHRFGNLQTVAGHSKPFTAKLDPDGLPRVGQFVAIDDPLACISNDISQTFKVERLKDTEPCYVEEVRSLGDDSGVAQRIGLKLRMNRNPVVGDKFSSRHGQKGVMSILFPNMDMPWTESGLTPDVIINPHAFPSRMTIGMLIESMAGKVGALNAEFQDGTPFQFNERNRAVDYFGQQLRAAGYNYYGSEPMYSGISGEPLMADIFIGVVFYQRLRHMVKDKFQARSTGPINSIHRQPIKGRKVHGGIRFGEMERDSLIAHGVSFMLQDRLMNSSDYHTTYVCEDCGSILAAHAVPSFVPPTAEAQSRKIGPSSESESDPNRIGKAAENVVTCRMCGTGAGCSVIAIPFVFLYLVNELAAMNIRLTLDIKKQ